MPRMLCWSLLFVASTVFADVSSLRLPTPFDSTLQPPPRRPTQGEVTVVIKLNDPPLAALNEGARRSGVFQTSAAQRSAHARLAASQNNLSPLIAAAGAREVARLRIALNAMVVKVDSSRVGQLSRIPGVTSVRPLSDYQLHLDNTVPYIGATVAQMRGLTGAGVRVAVIDSGIDYTHRDLGGAGTAAAYEAAWGTSPSDLRNTTTDGLFPTTKVVGGFDFVGEAWPNGAAVEDPDPIDLEGHGTHVADIIAGRLGVAPQAKLIAIKACSAVASACNGVALLQAVEFALDPNGDGDISDAVDVINMSLGSSYGQAEDDLSEASNNAARLGVVVVASAGNSGDRPYITGSPASAPEVISVAQSQVPTAKRFPLLITAPANIAGSFFNTEVVDWAPLLTGFAGEMVYVGRGCLADSYLGNPAGKIALIDRGTCNASEKVRRASDAGALGVLIGLVAPGDAVTFSNGGQCPAPADGTCKPTMVLTQATATLLKQNVAAPVFVAVSPSNFVSLERSIVASSARGPSVSDDALKPDIAAPGASISAIAGSGTRTEAFGGTSGAAPMVAGAAALLVQGFPDRSSREIKAMLMNTAETNLFTNPATLPGTFAPISRIGSGEVRVDQASEASAVAYSRRGGSPSISLGALFPTRIDRLDRQVEVKNFSAQSRVFRVEANFRYANDQASTAVQVSVPPQVVVGANSTRRFDVDVTIDPVRLPVWTLNGGSLGGAGPLLETVEYDGYITLTDLSQPMKVIRLPWHVLPHRAAAVETRNNLNLRNGAGSVELRNRGTLDGRVDVFALTGTSSKIPRAQLPQPGDNFAVIDLKAVGVRLADDAVQFAINTRGTRSHPNYPAQFDVTVDSNRDGVADFSVFNGELGAFASSGQNVTYVQALNADGTPNGNAQAYYFTDADLNSSNVILTAPLTALGLTSQSVFTFSIAAYDNYFTGNKTDEIANMTFGLAAPRFSGVGVPETGVPANGTSTLTVTENVGGATSSPSQTGLLLMLRDAPAGREADQIVVRP
jgi:minor extracellular serine protease Vpr